MDRQATLTEIERVGVIAVIRADSPDAMTDVCKALVAGGVTACEITMTVPGALDAIAAASRELGSDAVIGVGTVLDASTVQLAVEAGADFVVSPSFNAEVVAMARQHDKVIIPGALTPTEVVQAWTAGADVVKIFPANHFGPRYFRDLHGPLPDIRLTPTGGVDLQTTPEWIKAGAVAVGVGSALVKRDLVANADWPALTALAAEYVAVVAEARSS